MGQELLGTILVGPAKLDPKKIDEARAVLAEVRDQYIKYLGLDKDTDTEKALRQLGFKRLKIAAQRVMLYEGMDDWSAAVESVGEFLDGYTDDRFLKELAAVWQKGDRSVMSRRFTDPRNGRTDPSVQVWATGFSSWGDGPDEGSAYWIIIRADWFNLFGVLGIY